MKEKDIAKKISAYYDIPENDKEIAGHDEFSKEWVEARKAVDVAIFKAGLKEVVEFIDKEWDGTREQREAKLREWGV